MTTPKGLEHRISRLENAASPRPAPVVRTWVQLDDGLFTGPDGQRMTRAQIRATYAGGTNIIVVYADTTPPGEPEP